MTRLALVIVVSACSAASPSRAPAPGPTPTSASAAGTARRLHAAVNLTGSWTTGSGAEPAAALVIEQPQCNYSPRMWVLEQSGDTLQAWMFPESHAKGVAEPQAISRVATEGFVSGVDVTFGTTGPRYVLHYDSASGHLRGTLDGAPFWAVRLHIVQPQGCIPVP